MGGSQCCMIPKILTEASDQQAQDSVFGGFPEPLSENFKIT